MTLKMEVGKQYQREITKSVFTCIAVNETQAVLDGTSGFVVFWHSEYHKFKEYKEPIKHVRYFLIRKDGVVGPYTAKGNFKDLLGYPGNLGIQRVEFVEGTWDE